MIRALLGLALLVLALPAWAADRTFTVTNFDRVRVDGPFDVRLTVGQGGARASASGDARVLDSLSVDVQGTTLIVRRSPNGWGEQGKPAGPAPIVTIAAPALRGATVIGGGKLTVAGRLQADRLDFQVTGAGAIDARGIDADDLSANLIGNGGIALSGKAARARLISNGSGLIAASPLSVGDLTIRLEGSGEVQASARFTADLTSTGLGAITVAGNPKCTARATAGGPISCGAPPTP